MEKSSNFISGGVLEVGGGPPPLECSASDHVTIV